MRIKWVFLILPVLVLVNITACHHVSEYIWKRDSKGKVEIVCKAASAISPSAALNGRITVAWDLNTEGEKVAGYKIYYGLSSQKYTDCIDIGKPTESSPGVGQYDLISLEKGKRYYISIVAYDEHNKRSLFSREVTGSAK